MKKDLPSATSDQDLAHKLASSGMRMTAQREHVYHTLLQQTDHPTADEVYLRAKSAMPELSMATVYNTLDALVKCGLIKQVNVERTASRYCSNMNEHCHFFCEECGSIHDVDFKKDKGELPLQLPRNLVPTQVDISLRGRCADPLKCPNRNRN